MSKFFKNLIKDCDWSLCWPLTNEDTSRILNLQLKLEGFFLIFLKLPTKLSTVNCSLGWFKMVNLIDQQIENPLTSRNKIFFLKIECFFFFFFDIFVVISQGCAFLYLTVINDSISSLEVDATYWLITHHLFLWFLM